MLYVVFMRKVPIETLHERLSYNPETGIFTWKISNQWVKKGTQAGTICLGYVKISINKIIIPAHRIAWAMTYGVWPDKEIDHVNGIRSDNRIENLREASRQQNCLNRSKATNNKSGYKGVSWHNVAQKWQTHISIAGKSIYLGLFEDKRDAFNAYNEAAEKAYGVFKRH